MHQLKNQTKHSYKSYYEKNREIIKKKNLKNYYKKKQQYALYYKKNKIQKIEYQTIYNKKYSKTENGKKVNLKKIRKYRAKKNNIIETFTNDDWNQMLNKCRGVCPNCHKRVGRKNLALDHIYPISKAEKGRIYTINDIQPLCRGCNSSKGNKI